MPGKDWHTKLSVIFFKHVLIFVAQVYFNILFNDLFILILEYLIGKPLTVIKEFHSHLESMKFLPQETFHKQVR